MQLPEVEVFSAIAASGSLSGAARRLGVSPMTVSRRLASLERELDARLVQRTTRSTSLTPEGEAFLPFANKMLEAQEGARATLRSHSATASGLLKITAPTVFGQAVIMPLLPELMAENPDLQVDLTLSDSIVDIVGLGIDVAIRIATLRDSTLVARALASNPRVVCASPNYLANRGTPKTLDELKLHSCIALHGMPYWPFTRAGASVSIRAEGPFSANSVEAVRTASKSGLGLAMLTFWDVRNELDDGSLVLVELADVVPEQLSVTAVLPTRHHVPYRVEAFLKKLEHDLTQTDG